MAYFTGPFSFDTTTVAFPWVSSTAIHPIGSSVWLEATASHAHPEVDGIVSVSRLFEVVITGVNQPATPVIVAYPPSSPVNRIPVGSGVSFSSESSIDPDPIGMRHEWLVQAISGMFAQPLVLFGTEGTAAGFTVPDMVTDTAEVSVTLLLVDGLHELRESITVYLTREAARPNTPPVVAFESATVNRLAGEPITLSATAEDAEDDCTFTWTFLQNPAADMPASVSPVMTETGYKWQVSGNHPGLAPGDYQFRLTATEDRTGGASSAATVLVHVSSVAPTIGSVSPANMWPGGEVTITGTGFFGNVQVLFNGWRE